MFSKNQINSLTTSNVDIRCETPNCNNVALTENSRVLSAHFESVFLCCNKID